MGAIPGPYQLSKLPIVKIKALAKETGPDDAFIEVLLGDSRAGVRAIGESLVRNREKSVRRQKRQEELAALEKRLRAEGKSAVCGVDEAGRGPLAGPVVAAAVILRDDADLPGIDDSKKLTAKRREVLFDEVVAAAVSWGIGVVDSMEIDADNILSAAMRAMKTAVESMDVAPDVALVDGNRSPGLSCDERLVVDGDARCRVISAASVLAKVTRDRMMKDMDAVYPGYGFSSHKGYGAESHVEAIRRLGPSYIHRVSFRIVPRVAPRGTVAEVLEKRLRNAGNPDLFRRISRGIARMRDSLHADDLLRLRAVYRECAAGFGGEHPEQAFDHGENDDDRP